MDKQVKKLKKKIASGKLIKKDAAYGGITKQGPADKLTNNAISLQKLS